MKKNKKEWAKKIDLKYNLKVLWSLLSKYKGYIYGLIIITALIEVASFFDNFVFKYLVDKGTLLVEEQITTNFFAKILIITVLIFLGVRLISAVIWYFKVQFVNKLDSNMMSDLEKKSFWHILSLSYRFHSSKRTGSIISQFTRGVNKVESFVDAFIWHFMPVIFRIIFSVSVILYFDVKTALALVVMTICFIIAGVIITNKQKIPQAIANYREDVLKQNLSDIFMNVETVKYFAKEKRTFRYFSNLSHKLRSARQYFWRFFSIHSLVQTTILAFGIAAIFYLSFRSFMLEELTLGTIVLIYATVWKLLPQLFGLIHGYREFIRSSVDVDALFAMFKEENEVKDLPEAKRLRVKEGTVEFDKVSFVYPASKQQQLRTRKVLRDFTLKIKKNTKIALVGPSGSGKTTVVRLLYRLFDLDEGRILIDGKDINQVTQESLRSGMSIVTQEPLLFDNTLYFNIAYASPKATKKQVKKAIKFAQLDKFIAGLPYKENTIIGERGVKLSGGEKQRVSIARALLANKKILVLDEATSALDSETEKEIQRDLAKLMKDRTSIIIAHRLSTIMKADVIVVMEKGKIKEIGSHKELRNKRGGLYKRLWDLQQGGKL